LITNSISPFRRHENHGPWLTLNGRCACTLLY